MPTYSVCLDIGVMEPKYIETAEGDWIEDDDLFAFALDGIPTDNEKALTTFCAKHLEIVFDGDLDEPDSFTRIAATELVGPAFARIEASLIIMDLSIYFEVETEFELKEEDFEDIFHLIEPTLKTSKFSIAYGDFADFSVSLENASGNGTPLFSVWDNR